MLDRPVRARLAGPLDLAGRRLGRLGVTPGMLTLAGLVVGLLAALAAGVGAWWVALGLWLVSRVPDGLDGAVARATDRTSELGGVLDVVADFTVYGAFVVGCAIGNPAARVACLVVLLAYYANGAAFLALSAALERRRAAGTLVDERTFRFPAGLAEGTETVVVHALLVAVPVAMVVVAWTWAAVVAVTVGQRLVLARRLLA